MISPLVILFKYCDRIDKRGGDKYVEDLYY